MNFWDVPAESRLEVMRSRIRYARQMRGLTQRQAGDAAGLCTQYVSKIERGEIATPGALVIMGLAHALNVDAGWILDGKGRGPFDDAADAVCDLPDDYELPEASPRMENS